jgi:hypothetical protein
LIRDAGKWLGILSLIIGFSLWGIYHNTITAIQALMVAKISDEFKEPRIQATIEAVATQHAARILHEQIEPVVTDFKAEVGFKLADSEAMAATTRASLEDLTTLVELDDAAGFGDRKAYENLLIMAQGKGPHVASANRRVALIIRELSVYREFPGMFSNVAVTRAGKQVDVGQLSTDELLELLSSGMLSKAMVPAVMNALDAKPQKDLCKSGAVFLVRSNSLPACAALCGTLEHKMGPKAPFLAFSDWSRICESELAAH